MQIIPLACSLEAGPADATMVAACMLFPDDRALRDELVGQMIAHHFREYVKNNCGDSEEITLHRMAIDLLMRQPESAFKDMVRDRLHLGQLAGRMMNELSSLQSYREAAIASNSSLVNEKKIQPSRKLIRDITIRTAQDYEKTTGEKLGAYSDKVLRKAWDLMEPVAHLWGGEFVLNMVASEMRSEPEWKNMPENERYARGLRVHLGLAKGFLARCSNVYPHKGRHQENNKPIFDNQHCFWVAEEIDDWLQEIQQPALDKKMKQFQRDRIEKARRAS